ncbi:MAG: hypothetical protein RMN25_03140 [Anaerolineae bacterium]|nr:hypothetical protein [Thermoflexales bacterium]MDW8406753.1 hypothetical protein [Anaerolineae bacterium]
MELLRRGIALTCLLSAIACALAPQPALLRFGAIDFAERQKDSWFEDERKMPLEDFIARETKDRLIALQGASWTDFFSRFEAAVSGEMADWQNRLNVGWSAGTMVYFRPDEPWARDIAPSLSDDHPFSYLALAGPAGARYLTVTWSRPKDMLDDAPPGLLYPWRSYSVWLALIGLAAYILLPRRKRDPEALVYSTVRAVVLPDIVGLFLAGFFFALPFWIVPANAPDPNVLNPDGGWLILTVVMWAFAAAGVVILAIAARYAAFSILPGSDAVAVTTWLSAARYPYADMQQVRPYVRRVSKGWIGLGVLASLLNWRAAAPTLMLASSESRGIEVVLRDGRKWRVAIDALEGLDRLLNTLRAKGVEIDPALQH